MLIDLRNALMTDKSLPYDAEVEYLESNGMQWIDTGIRPVNGIGAMISFMMTGYDQNLDPTSFTSNGIMGAQNDEWSKESFSVAYYATRYLESDPIEYEIWSMVGMGESSYMDTSYIDGIDTQLDIQLGVKYSLGMNYQNLSSMQIDGVTYATVSNSDKAGCEALSSNIFLFGVSTNTGASDTTLGICRIYDVVITNGSSVVAHYKPVRKGSVGYMYDSVSNTLLGNAGIGEFTCGPDVPRRERG